MHRRYDTTNIPIELLRTLVAIADLGSLTQAANKLKLTQPAISAQVRRLQSIVGAEVLSKWGAGVRVSAAGETVLRYARRILAMNDQILLHSRARMQQRVVRIAISAPVPPRSLAGVFRALAQVSPLHQIEFGNSQDFARELASGFLDLAVMAEAPSPGLDRLAGWSEPMAWLCAKDFLLSPGKPIPLIGSPRDATHRLAVETLDRAGQIYITSFFAEDWSARLAAMQAGLGYVAAPHRAASDDCKIGREHYLPPLPDLSVGIYAGAGAAPREFDTVAAALVGALRPPEKAHDRAAEPAKSRQRRAA